jgi:hypothetical protein
LVANQRVQSLAPKMVHGHGKRARVGGSRFAKRTAASIQNEKDPPWWTLVLEDNKNLAWQLQ